jgi:hypothetical protein
MKNISLFDSFGRGIVERGATGASQTSRHYFKIQQSPIDLPTVFRKSQKYLGVSTSFERFEEVVNDITTQVKKSPRLANLLNGPHYPFVLPKISVDNLGEIIQSIFIPALESSYRETFPSFDFKNQIRQSLDSRISILEQSRHENVIESMKVGEVVGILFPALSDFSIDASLGFLKNLPTEFSLAGGFDVLAAFIGNPAILFNDNTYPPMLWMSALENEDKKFAFYMEAYGYDLNLNTRPHFGSNYEYWVNSLTIAKEV